MALTTEILIFEASQAFRENKDVAIDAFKIVLKADGVHPPAYYGLQNEDQSTGYIFIDWDSYDAHKAVGDLPCYPALRDALQRSLGGHVDMYHVVFSALAPLALDKPVTEVLVLTLKAPENRTAVVEILSGISEASEKTVVFGQTREDENKYILIGGWASVETHMESVAKSEVAATLDKLYSLANKDHFFHTNLSQYRQ